MRRVCVGARMRKCLQARVGREPATNQVSSLRTQGPIPPGRGLAKTAASGSSRGTNIRLTDRSRGMGPCVRRDDSDPGPDLPLRPVQHESVSVRSPSCGRCGPLKIYGRAARCRCRRGRERAIGIDRDRRSCRVAAAAGRCGLRRRRIRRRCGNRSASSRAAR